jgi:hypothetical protein
MRCPPTPGGGAGGWTGPGMPARCDPDLDGAYPGGRGPLWGRMLSC